MHKTRAWNRCTGGQHRAISLIPLRLRMRAWKINPFTDGTLKVVRAFNETPSGHKPMRSQSRMLIAIGAFLLALSAAPPSALADAQSEKSAPSTGNPSEVPATPNPEQPPGSMLDPRMVETVLGKQVRSIADENMGRIVDILVDSSGQVRAAVIDFGGFLGVGSRKIAVDWGILRFEAGRIAADLMRAQVKAAPEYKEGKPIFVLGPSGATPVAEPGPASSQ
jgi:hypothetical protein